MVFRYQSGILKDGLNYVIGMPHKYFIRVRNRYDANVGTILRGKIRVKIGEDSDDNPKYSDPIEFEGTLLKRGKWYYYLLLDSEAEKKLMKHYNDHQRMVAVEITGRGGD